MLKKDYSDVFATKSQDAISQCNLGGGPQFQEPSEDGRNNSQNTIRRIQRDILCVLEYASQGVLPDSIEPYPRIHVKYVQRGFSPEARRLPNK